MKFNAAVINLTVHIVWTNLARGCWDLYFMTYKSAVLLAFLQIAWLEIKQMTKDGMKLFVCLWIVTKSPQLFTAIFSWMNRFFVLIPKNITAYKCLHVYHDSSSPKIIGVLRLIIIRFVYRMKPSVQTRIQKQSLMYTHTHTHTHMYIQLDFIHIAPNYNKCHLKALQRCNPIQAN